jgi:hypothetical protein
VTFWADKLGSFVELVLYIHVSAFYVLNQRAFFDIERFAEGATVTGRDIRRTALRAENDLIVEFLF